MSQTIILKQLKNGKYVTDTIFTESQDSLDISLYTEMVLPKDTIPVKLNETILVDIKEKEKDCFKITSEWVGLIGGAFAGILALISIWKLINRDEDKQNQIDRLSSIADNLESRLDLENKRYLNYILPSVTAVYQFSQKSTLEELVISFQNNNPASNITSIDYPIENVAYNHIGITLQLVNGLITFGIKIESQKIPSFFQIPIDYTMGDGTKFIQEVSVKKSSSNSFDVIPSIIKVKES